MREGILFRDDRHQIVMENIFILLGNDRIERIGNTEACDQQGGTACNTDHGHPETFFIAEQITTGHLPGEREVTPQWGNPFQQDPFSCLGCTGQHQSSRCFGERAATGQCCYKQGKHGQCSAGE